MSEEATASPASQAVLQSVFGFDQFRPQQAAIIEHLNKGQDAFVLMPTGGGKSLCYQVPGLVREGLTVVVSPLIALMQDQVQSLQQVGVAAAFVNSTVSGEPLKDTLRQARSGQLRFLYLAPERLVHPWMLAFLQQTPVSLIAIDEAHCVSQWGHEFRPEYAQLRCLREHFPAVPMVALTATADDVTRQDIVSLLGLEQARWFVSSFDRPNIHYRIQTKHQPRRQLLNFIEQHHRGEAGIVYCLSRKRVEETAAWLAEEGLPALAYHAGMSTQKRTEVLNQFLYQEGVIVVATIAFGMGIDKPNVRFVAHLDLPKSIEAYYQETGRAGRDGLPANAWMVYGLQDVIFLREMMQSGEGALAFKRTEQSKLDAMLGLCETTACRRQALLGYFGESQAEPCGHCDNCQQPPKTFDATVAAQKALSCVFRTGQRFGANHLVEVLLGSDNERIKQFGHDKLSTFGIGKELSAETWRSLFRQLVAQGFITAKPGGMGALMLTERARAVLKREVQLTLRYEEKPRRLSRDKKRSSGASSTVSVEQERLWQALRAERSRLAKAANVPPYTIFHDASLMLMMEQKPRTKAELSNISGVGQKKLEKYGEAFLAVIKAQ